MAVVLLMLLLLLWWTDVASGCDRHAAVTHLYSQRRHSLVVKEW